MSIQPVILCGDSGTRLWFEGQGVNKAGTVAGVTWNGSAPATAALAPQAPLWYAKGAGNYPHHVSQESPPSLRAKRGNP